LIERIGEQQWPAATLDAKRLIPAIKTCDAIVTILKYLTHHRIAVLCISCICSHMFPRMLASPH